MLHKIFTASGLILALSCLFIPCVGYESRTIGIACLGGAAVFGLVTDILAINKNTIYCWLLLLSVLFLASCSYTLTSKKHRVIFCCISCIGFLLSIVVNFMAEELLFGAFLFQFGGLLIFVGAVAALFEKAQ